MRIKILLVSLIFSFGLFVSNAQAVKYWGDKLLTDEAVDFKEQASSPTNPSTDRWKLYFKSDGSVYKLDESGVETELASKASEIQDSDGDTKVQTEEGADDDTIRFDVAGSEVGTWTSSLLTTTTPLTVGGAVKTTGIEDSDGDTAVKVEESADEDIIRFDVLGSQKARIDSTGLGVLNDSPSEALDVTGNAEVSGTLTAGGKISATNGTNGVELLPAGGAIEMFRSDSIPFIDFKTTSVEDFDVRIQQRSNGLDILTGGDGATSRAAYFSSSQQLGLGTGSPDASALLDLVSTSKGLGLPSMTTTQRDAISTPRDGLAIYNSTTGEVNVRENGAWVAPSSPTKIQDADGDTKIDTEDSADEDIIRFDISGAQAGRIDTTGWMLKGNDVSGDGPLHIGAGLAGAVTANANADEFIIESDQSTFGLTLLGSNTSDQRIHFGRTSDPDAGIISFSQSNQFIELYVNSTGGRNLRLAADHSIFNPDGVDLDFQIEGDTNVNLFYLNAGTDNIGLGSASPDASALLDMVSTNKGLGVPSMTGTQRDAISTPRDGLVVHNSTTDTIDARLNSAWESLATTSGSGLISCETVQASTSGTSIDFTSLPSSIRRITVIFDQVSLDGTNAGYEVQIGDSGGLETSGYASSSNDSGTINTSTSGYFVRINGGGGAARQISGHMTLNRITGNRWEANHVMHREGSSSSYGAGTKTLSAELDRLSVTPGGANNFDNGQINVCHEQ